MDLISSASDFCIVFGICDYLGENNEIDLESRRNTASVVISPRVSENVTQPRPQPHAAENVSSRAQIAGGNQLARASPLENTWHAYGARSTAERNFLLSPNQQTRKIVVERANEETDEELYRLCKIADDAEILKIGEFPSNKACTKQRWIGLHSIPCGEADRPTSVEGGGILQGIFSGSRMRPIKEIHIFNKEGSECIDLKVPSTSDPEILIWVDARTEEVQNCRQIAAIKTVILTEHQSNQTSEGSGKLVAQSVKLKAKGNLEHEHEQQPIPGRSWSAVPHSRDRPEMTQSGLSNKTARLTRHVGKLDRTGALPRENTPGLFKKTSWTWSKDWHRIRFLESSPVKHRQKDIKFAGKKDHRWQVSNSIKRFFILFSRRRTNVYQRSTRSLRRESGYIDASSQTDWERIRIIAVSYWNLKIRRFNNLEDLCQEDLEYNQGRKRCTSHECRHRTRIPTRSTSPTLTWTNIMTDCLWLIWKQRRIRWYSIRQRTGVSCATTQFRPSFSQRSSIPKTDQKGSEKKNMKRSSRLPRKRVDIATDSWGTPPGITQNKKQVNLESWHQSLAQQRSSKKTEAANSTCNVLIFQKEADREQFSVDVERSLADWQPYRKRTLKLHLRTAAKSSNHSYIFEFPNKFDEANAMAHKKIRFCVLRGVTISANAQGKESPTQSHQPGGIYTMDALIAGKKTKHTEIKCSSIDIQKKNCKAGSLEWEKDSVIMQNFYNHVNYMNRVIREGWISSKARRSLCL